MDQSCPWMRNCNFATRLCQKAIKRKILTKAAGSKHASSSATTALKFCLYLWKQVLFLYYTHLCLENVSNLSFLQNFLFFFFQTSSEITVACLPAADASAVFRPEAGHCCHRATERQEKWRTSGKSVLSLCPVVSTIREKRHFRGSFSSFFVYL